MDHVRSLKKFLKTIALSSSNQATSSLHPGFISGRIPEDIVSDELRHLGHESLFLTGKECNQYYEVYKVLRAKIGTEHLSDNELKERLWYLVCDVFVNRKKYLEENSLEGKIKEFIISVLLPLEEFEVMFAILNFSIGDYTFEFWDSTIKKFDETMLQISNKTLKDKMLKSFHNKTIILLKEDGNNRKFVIERARARAKIKIKALQTYFSELRILRDENLLFELSEYGIARKTGETNGNWISWDRKRDPLEFGYHKSFEDHFIDATRLFNEIQKFPRELQAIMERTVYWIGKSIEDENYDTKVIYLCTAMESILTTKADSRKGEVIAYRMMLLGSLIDKGFLFPQELLGLYILRSNIIHGSEILEATSVEYGRLLFAAREILLQFVEIIKREGIKSRSSFIKFLETSTEVKKVIEWLENNKDSYSQEIKEALQESTEKKN